ncbi:NADH-quinone oxidoreductase subunit J [bacterium]|nr:NADH-quinone oxidoreductase subunit J [bacterium]
MEVLIFTLFAIISIFFGICVIIAKKPIYSALSMVMTMIGTAGLFALLKAPFIAIMQLWIYAGAVMVFVIFVIMMLSPKDEPIIEIKKNILAYIGTVFSIILLIILIFTVVRTGIPESLGSSPGFGNLEEISKLLFTDYLVPFELVSLVLLVAIVGAIIIGRKKVGLNK